MRRRLRIGCVVAFLGAGLAGCGTGAPAQTGTAVAARDQAIASMHVTKCGACHTLPDPKTRTRRHLEEAFTRHKRRVHLTAEEWAAMVDYLAMPEGETARQP
jgi:hypothetical protein